jgi:hypothetical protein
MSNQSVNLTNKTNDTTLDIQVKEPDELKVFRFIIFGLVVVASLLGNAIVLKAVWELVRRSLTHYLVANLAVAEIIVSCLNPFLVAYAELMYWPYGEVMCHVLSPMQTLSIVVITNTLAAIAFHRYRVFSSRHSRRKLTSKEISLLVLMIWVSALAIVFPSFLFQQQIPSSLNPGKFWCVEIFPGDTSFPSPAMRRFYMTRFILNYVLPIIIMSASYGFVSAKLRHHRNRSIRDIESTRETSDQGNDVSTQQPNITSLPPPPQQQQQQQNGGANIKMAQRNETQESTRSRPVNRVKNRMNKRKDFAKLERDLLKMFYMIILVFIICYFPYQVYFLLEYFRVIHWTTWRYFDVIRIYVFLIPCFSSALHPICYGTMSTFFARTFSRLVLCKNKD